AEQLRDEQPARFHDPVAPGLGVRDLPVAADQRHGERTPHLHVLQHSCPSRYPWLNGPSNVATSNKAANPKRSAASCSSTSVLRLPMVRASRASASSTSRWSAAARIRSRCA